MKPRRLEIEGLRSYRKKAVIEFEPDGLLVITGATGAGKSSILEAMMFALYGVYSGNSKSNKELIADRCDEMRVTLEFEVNGKVYTAHRAVGRKGAGSFALAQGDQVLCHDGNRLTAEVTALLGLDEEQFKKTVFLPQGAFQNFLTSKPKERVDLLKRLLQVEPLDQLEARVQLWLSQSRQVLDRAEGSRSRYPGDPAGRLEQLITLQTQAEAEEHQRQQHFQTLELLRQQLQQARQLDQQLQQRHQMLGGFDSLQSFDEEAMNRLKAQLLDQVQQADQQVQAHDQQQREWAAQAPAHSSADLQQARRQLQEWLTLHQDGQRLEQECQQLQSNLAALQEHQQQLQESQHQARSAADEIQPRLSQQRQAWQQLSQRLQEQLRTQQQRQQWEQQLRQQESQLQDAQQQLQIAQNELEQARQRWHEGELYRICGQHTPGQPCPVCEQSLPAHWTPPDAPHGQTLDQAEENWRQAQALWQGHEAALRATLQQLHQLSDPTDSVDPAQLSQQEQEVQQLEQLAQDRLRKLAQLEGEWQALQRESAAAQQRLPAAQQQWQLSLQRAQPLRQQLEERFGTPLEDQLQQQEEQRAAWEEAHLRLRQASLDAQGQLQQAQRSYAQQVEQPLQQLALVRQQAAQALGCSSDLPLAALLQHLQQQRHQLQQELDASRRHQQEVESHFQQGLQENNLSAWEAAQSWLRQAQDQASRARHDVEMAQRQLQEVADLDRLLAPARQQVDRIALLARLLGHQKAKGTKMTFPQWYMQQRQGELLALASHHLEALSGGQFRFEEDMDDIQSFRVLDLFSGVPRAVTTLSGGETFLASLSLAVALAELVGRRGGQLQALFLDEGFGTLSAECLDRALTALEQLAAQGRLIGIISHVPLIAERIEQVWWVRKSPGGSEIVKATEHMRRELLRQELATFDPRMHPLFS